MKMEKIYLPYVCQRPNILNIQKELTEYKKDQISNKKKMGKRHSLTTQIKISIHFKAFQKKSTSTIVQQLQIKIVRSHCLPLRRAKTKLQKPLR